MSSQCPICQHEVQEGWAVCPSCGFRLQGTTEKFEPIPVENLGVEVEPKENEAIIKVVRGPQTGVIYKIIEDESTIGRSPQCTIFLNDMTVSRLHATIVRDNGVFVIQDEDSFNGLWINNMNVQTKALKPGDVIQIGSFCLLFEEKAAD